MINYSAIEKSNFLNSELKRYIKSTFQIEDQVFLQQFNSQIDSVELMKGPFISATHPFKTGCNIEDLIDEGILSDKFHMMKSLDLKRPLYDHQEEAIRKSVKNKNLVISTGTGSGKTESFLIPILNEISRDIENNKFNRGVQALLLYPMNALANDQRDRLREILENFPEITFGFYTGETEEKKNVAYQKYESENYRAPLKNEIISREQVRETPPNILFTNYSMLEYILLRPNDKALFNVHNTENWKYIVLDEAHIYRGALGIEISMLMRRLLSYISSEPKFILTSATLAKDKKDYPAVVNFAKKLTSKSFDNDSIILGKRFIRVRPQSEINFNKDDYIKLYEDENFVKKTYSKYISNKCNDTREMIYEILLADKNYFDFIDALSEPLNMSQLIKKLNNGWGENHILAIIDLIAKVNGYNNLFLVDIRYHTFIKTLDGAQVTVKPEKNMYLRNTSQHSYQDKDGNLTTLETFELGVCKYCRSPYLVGRIVGDRFHRLDDEDLYEQFSDRFNKQSNILLLKESVSNIDNSIKNVLNMNLCNKCGVIYDADNINAKPCRCGNEFIIETLTIPSNKDKSNTNLSKCLSCGSRNNYGVIQSFYIGKDSATAIIAQLLYKKMGIKPNHKLKKENNIKPINIFEVKPRVSINDSLEKTKQLISFSDSRQQASFFATYFEERHIHFLRKRLIVKSLENKKSVELINLIEMVEYEIDKNDLFESRESPNKQAWITVLIELLDVDRKFSLSGLGLVAFVPKHEMKNITEEQVSESFDGMSLSDFDSLIKFILNSMRTIPAVDYFDKSNLTFEEGSKYLSYRRSDNAGLTFEPNSINSATRSLLPANKGGNIYTNYVMRAFNVDFEASKVYLEKIGNYLFQNGNYKYLTNNKLGAKHITYDAFKVYNPKNVDWFVCNVCGTLTYFNINNTCVKSDCKGHLKPCDPDKVNKDNFYYGEYKTKEIEKIRVEEHTAQLSHEKAREYQRDFKNGSINILSSSTTFEMGVDLGALDTVYMRNVPPTPANYVQRAGRAGRRQDTAAYVITFCSSNSHDYTYFESPLKMIDGSISPPYFELDNKKIVYRHILSTALSSFFESYPKYFEKVHFLVMEKGIDKLKCFLKDNKKPFIDFIEENIYENFNKEYSLWFIECFDLPESNFKILENDYKNNYLQLSQYLESESLDATYSYEINSMISKLREEKTLNSLSRFNIIPSYSFPIDTVTLQIPSSKNYDISRDLSTAISEYAPESEIMVDKKKYKSRYINTQKGVNPIQYHYIVCDGCGMLSISLLENDDKFEKCSNCGVELTQKPNIFIKPVYGFISEIEEMSDRTIKPKRTYSSDYYYIGNSEELEDEVYVGSSIRIKSVKDNHLALLNESNFYTCQTCGYTEIFKDSYFSTNIKEHNIPKISIKCTNDILNKRALGHDFRTDIVIIEFLNKTIEKNDLISVMYALIEGISNYFEIERNDISGIVQTLRGKYQIILFDNVPGGAGHVKRLLNSREFKKALDYSLIKVSQECCDESSSCYNCLRNYRNQRQHNFIKRGVAKNILEEVRDSLNQFDFENDINIRI